MLALHRAMTTPAPPQMSGRNRLLDRSVKTTSKSISAARKPSPRMNAICVPQRQDQLARLACATTTPFGVPVEPEV